MKSWVLACIKHMKYDKIKFMHEYVRLWGEEMSELAGNGCQIIVPFEERKPLKDIEKI